MTADRRAALLKKMLLTYVCAEGSTVGAMSAALDLARNATLDEAAKIVREHSHTRGKSLTHYAELLIKALEDAKENT